MSGHSKWSTIKRKKAANDAKRGKIYTRILREVTVASRMGGGDPDGNPRLRAAIQDARTNNVPSDNIARAIAKGTGELEGANYEEIVYEGYGPGGVAVFLETMTDNKNRTVSEVRHAFAKYGGNLGENGCVNWMFDRRGHILIDPESMSEEEFMELALEIGAEDIATDEGYEIFTSPNDYSEVRDALEKELEGKDISFEGKLAMLPQNYVDAEPGNTKSLVRFLEMVEDLDDVQNVWTNVSPSSLPDED